MRKTSSKTKPDASPSILARLTGKPPSPLAAPPRITPAAEAEAYLERLRKDLKHTVGEQIRHEQAKTDVPAAIYKSRVTLEGMIAKGEREAVALHAQQAEANYQTHADTWSNLQRERALTVMSLRRINREIEALKASFRSGGMQAEPVLDGHSFYLLGTGKQAPGVYGRWATEYLSQAMLKGIITEKEFLDD